MRQNILFVCTGNTCRSAMAAHLAAQIKDRHLPLAAFRFDSAGLAAVDGYPPSENAVAALKEWDIDITDHRSKKFQSYMVERADLIACMTEMHKNAILTEYPETAGKVFFLGELSGSNEEIPDPYMGSLARYRLTRDVLHAEIQRMLEKLSETKGKGE
ncbi:MAG TPA: low molecular weight protein arginine phosphatase [Clostridiales bacterium]|nr:low molecular weight protein arginine phosphatase [Clostridiales bacterium]